MQRPWELIQQHRVGSAVALLCVVILLFWLFCLPENLFEDTSYSSVILSRDGELLGARIAADGQWRFPPRDTVPQRYATALIEFEDKHFRYHPGVDPLAVARAIRQNSREGRTISGASTITMQVIRLSRRKERSLTEKILEAFLATRLEAKYSKDHILALYASHAPFGSNVVGLDAASWRYYSRSPEDLSWGEVATLAVLPNSPSSIHPGKNREKLLLKRNRLLERLHRKGKISDSDFSLALEEPLPSEPKPLPQYASHYVENISRLRPGQRVLSSIDLSLQRRIEALTDRWSNELSSKGVADMAAVVVDVHSGEILAWIGNADLGRKRPGAQVDVASAPRSTGSVLKPLLYCAALQEGVILPRTLLRDTPTNINGFTPQNFDLQYSGAVSASEALTHSLNVPFVHLLKDYGVPKFYTLLQRLGISTLTRSPSDYGLSLILGGTEGKLGELTALYARISEYYQSEEENPDRFPLWNKTALWYCFDVLKDLSRPDEIDLNMVRSARKIAWKTGTSYGFRDAWAIGFTKDYAVGVWAGNAEGQGVSGLVGGRTAGPVLFDIFNVLPASEWFEEPASGKNNILAEVCRESGRLKGPYCPDCDTLTLPKGALRSQTCEYHKLVDGTAHFLLPPAMEWYYRRQHPEYKALPPRNTNAVSTGPMEFIYPEYGSRITIPRQLDGSVKGVNFSLAHTIPDATVYWHLDSDYITSTRYFHELSICPEPGNHTMTVVDSEGNSLSIRFSIVE